MDPRIPRAPTRPRTDAEISDRAAGGPNTTPTTDIVRQAPCKAPRTKTLRRALGLTQEAFAARYQIPLGTLRDWEQGKAEPDQSARAYLRAIAGDPAGVEHALYVDPRPTNDPILKQFKMALQRIYGDRIDRVVLFGSRARGDGGNDSDYDVAVFLRSLPDHRTEIRRLADLRVDFLDATGAFFDTKPYPASSYFDRSPLMHEIRRDGVDL